MRSNGGVMSVALGGRTAGGDDGIGAGGGHDRRRPSGARSLARTAASASIWAARPRRRPSSRDGVPAIEEGYVIGGAASGQPMQLPVVDIVEVGAGGGSIAWIDADRRSACRATKRRRRSRPGLLWQGQSPSGRDRCQSAAWDASIRERFLNGDMPLDAALAERAIAAKIAAPLGLSVRDAALGMLAHRRCRNVAGGARGFGQQGRRPARHGV